MDKVREQFEAWRLAKFCGGEERLKKCSNAPDVYYYTSEQEAWKAWQASRAALVVELPNCFETYGYSAEVARVATDCCADAIEEAGIRTK